MVFLPPYSLKAKDDFDTSSGHSPQYPVNQNVTGGYVTLLPNVIRSSTYFQPWVAITGWHLNNGMSSRLVVTGSFQLKSGYYYSSESSLPSGYQAPIPGAGAWEIYTPPLTSGTLAQGYTGYSGKVFQYLITSTGTPHTGFADSQDPDKTRFTLEFEVSSHNYPISGQAISGFGTGTITVSGLPRQSGILCHGVYISNGTNWDFVEVRPDGVRSANHPELAISMDMSTMRKFRVGVNANTIYMIGENGHGMAGIGKFDMPVRAGDTAKIAIGAPYTGAHGFAFSSSGILGHVGRTAWDNVRILTGDMELDVPTGLKIIYTPGSTYTFFTNDWTPGLGISDFLYASVGYVGYLGGSTVVTAQNKTNAGYSDIAGASITLTRGDSPKLIPLDLAPIYGPTRTSGDAGASISVDPSDVFTPAGGDSGVPNFANSLRFKIEQTSDKGTAPSPAVDYIEIAAIGEYPFLELVPNWKLKNIPTVVKAAVKSGEFISFRPPATAFTTTMLVAGPQPGLFTGTFIEDSRYKLTGTVRGTGLISQDGPYDTSYQTYAPVSGIPATGSEAGGIFGHVPVFNFFPNPELSEYQPATHLSGIYISGHIDGTIAKHVEISGGFSGVCNIFLDKLQVIRPGSSNARSNYSSGPGVFTDYAQKVTYTSITAYTGHYGALEARIPSGIFSGTGIAGFDLKITAGSGLYFYLRNDARSWASERIFLPSEYYEDYHRVGIPVSCTPTNTGRYYIGLSPSGNQSGKTVEFIIDNISLSPYVTSYLEITGTPIMIHTNVGTSNGPSKLAERAATVIEGYIQLDSYPTGLTGTFFQKLITASINGVKTGISFYITNSGFPLVEFDLTDGAWISGGSSQVQSMDITQVYNGRKTLTGNSKIPLGKWSHLAFVHETQNFLGFGAVGFSGMNISQQFASCNRANVLVNGRVVATEDCMNNWNNRDSRYTGPTGAVSPWTSYITEGTGTIYIGSGLLGRLDSVSYSRPPLVTCEEVAIRGTKLYLPHFIPDVMIKPCNPMQQVQCAVGSGSIPAFIAVKSLSIWNLTSPGPYTNWDVGPCHNHLLFSGNVSKSTTTPYPGWSGVIGSTSFRDSGNAIAKYSSAYDFAINWSGAFTGLTDRFFTLSQPSQGGIAFGSWVRPYETGMFYRIVRDETNIQTTALELGITGASNGTGYFVVKQVGVGNSGVWTGRYGKPSYSGAWTHIGAEYIYTPDKSLGLVLHSMRMFVDGVQRDSFTGQLDTVGPGAQNHFKYDGRSGDVNKGAVILGRMNCDMSDAFLSMPYAYSSTANAYAVDWAKTASISGNKGGLYQAIVRGSIIQTGVTWSGVYGVNIGVLQASLTGDDSIIWVAAMDHLNGEVPYSAGFGLYDKAPFREVESYYFAYDDDPLKQAFGDTNSPIRIGYVVPDNAVNLARIDSPEFSVEHSISTIDLSDKNPNNLSSFRGGLYTLVSSLGQLSGSVASGSLRGINEYRYSGQGDFIYSGQLDTEDVRVTSLSIRSTAVSDPSEAFFCYLVGRGEWGVHVPSSFPHLLTGSIDNITGASGSIQNHLSNIDKTKASLFLTDSAGRVVGPNVLPWDLSISPINLRQLRDAINSGVDVDPEGLNYGTGYYTGRLPDGVFSVVLLTKDQIYRPGETLWVNYPGYRFSDGKLDRSRREIVNSVPIMRKTSPKRTVLPGQFRVEMDPANYKRHLLTIHGIYSGLTGEFV